MVLAKATIIAPITISNVVDMNFRNVAIQAGTADKLEDYNNNEDSKNLDRTLIINIISNYLNLFT
jgi:hypothetical protein|tara:strand:+ start:15027 stop:15221 length:195 start_codon:yes stop_codon:yes gene_type:complete